MVCHCTSLGRSAAALELAGNTCAASLAWLTAPGVQILPSVMPDGLHPNAAGMESLAQCLSPMVDKYFPA